jgi:hypothetical protein
MAKLLPLLIGGALVLGTGVLDGLWTGRWYEDPSLEKAAARLENVPTKVGDWEMVADESESLQDEDVTRAGIVKHCLRRYRNQHNHRQVTVLLVCGRPGPVSAHTPDVCYQGAGYTLVSGPTSYVVPARAGATDYPFKGIRVRSTMPDQPAELRVLWSWLADGSSSDAASGGWKAPDEPRFRFAHCRVLYKLYVVRQENSTETPGREDPGLAFLQAFLPALDEALRRSDE